MLHLFSKILLGLFLTSLLFLQAHAQTASDASNPSATLEQRINQYLTALKLNDLATAYKMESGSLDGTLTADTFHRLATQSSAQLIDYKIKAIAVENDSATVDLDVVYQYPQLHKPYETTRKASWKKIDGQWYQQSSKPKL